MGPPVIERLPYGEGIFRRRFRLQGEPRRVVADMEDDFHRFHVELDHDGERVTEIRGEAHRYPWTECPGATLPLRELIGLPLSPHVTAAAAFTNPRANCTHLFDVASLAVTHASRNGQQRQYDIAVPDRDEGRTRATLHRDAEPLLAWDVSGTKIEGPPPYTGVELRGSQFIRWAEAEFDPELAEAVIALRRASFIAIGRSRDLDDAPSADSYMRLTKGSCHTFTPGIAERAMRVKGTTYEFTDAPERLLADAL